MYSICYRSKLNSVGLAQSRKVLEFLGVVLEKSLSFLQL